MNSAETVSHSRPPSFLRLLLMHASILFVYGLISTAAMAGEKEMTIVNETPIPIEITSPIAIDPQFALPSLDEIGRSLGLAGRPEEGSGRLNFGFNLGDEYYLVDHVSVRIETTGAVDADSLMIFRFAVGGVVLEFPVLPLTQNGSLFFTTHSFSTPVIFNPGSPIALDVFPDGLPFPVEPDFSRSVVTLQGRVIPASLVE